MRKHNFTLVELLTVIAVIAILAGLILAAVNGAVKKAEMTKAKAAIVTLHNAIKQYESTYGRLPIASGVGAAPLTTAQYQWLIQLLQGDSTIANYTTYNPKNIRFLEVQGNSPGVYQDPWDQNLHVAFDHDYNGQIDGSSTGASIPGLGSTIYYSVAIWSVGPDGESDTGNDKKNADNVYSFNTTWDKANNKVTITK